MGLGDELITYDAYIGHKVGLPLGLCKARAFHVNNRRSCNDEIVQSRYLPPFNPTETLLKVFNITDGEM